MALVAIGEIGGVDEAEGGGGEEFTLLALAGGGFDQFGGIPLAEVNFQALQLKPALEQVDLGRFPGAIQTLHSHEATRKFLFGKRLHSRGRGYLLPHGKQLPFVWMRGASAG